MLSNFFIIKYCYDYLLNQIPIGLLLYSHIPTAFLALAFSGYTLYKSRNLPSFLLFAVSVSFGFWCAFDLMSWLAIFGANTAMFTWVPIDIFTLCFFFFSYYFLYSFSTGKDLPVWQKIGSLTLMVPTILLTLIGKTLSYYDANTCVPVENNLITSFPFYFEGIFLVVIIAFIIYSAIKIKEKNKKRETLLAGFGIFLFLFFFFSATLTVKFLIPDSLSSYAYNYEIYGLFGMPILLIFLGFLIVKYKSFNVKVFGAQALIVGLIALIGSEFFFVQNLSNTILTAFTLVITGIIGINLIRSVKREVEQREKIESLAKDLQSTNEQLASANIRLKELDQQKSEFVSLASHQLRSPLSAIRGYASMISEGEYGPIADSLKEPIAKIGDSVKSMIIMVEDFLSVSRIEQGRMKFDFTDFDLKKLTEEVVYELKPNADKAGLTLSFKAEPGKKFLVSADQTKLKQVIINFLDNSIKYTPKGSVEVSIKKNAYDKITIAISDTGVGMTAETIAKLFNKFTRAADANKTNVQGTGLGLYVAKKMIEAHKGKVWAESPGEGKGSTFFIELQGK